MTTQQRLLLATGISMIFFIGYSIFFPPPEPIAKVDTQNITAVSTPVSVNSAPSIQSNSAPIIANSSAPQIGTTSSAPAVGNSSENIVEVFFDGAILTIDKLGRISSKTLLAEKFKDENGISAQLVTHFTPKPLEIRFADAELNQEAFKTDYLPSVSKLNIENGQGKLVLTQTLKDVTVTKTINFHPNGTYDFEIALSEPKRFFISNGMRPDVNEYAFTVQGSMVKVGEELTIIEDGDAMGTSIFRDVTLASSFDRYYASIFYNLDPTTNIIIEADRTKNPMIFVEGLQNLAFSGYLGPKDYELLKSIDEELIFAIEYGFITLIAKPIFFILNYLHGIFGNWGWAIVVLTILIRFILYPLTYKGMISMQKLKEIAPEIKELQRKHKGNPQQMQVKMMELYKKKGANPMGGCLPLLLQLPIFFAIYRVLLNAVELQGEGWIFWIEDLAKMDPYFVLPILMGGTMFWQQHVTPNNFTDPMQEKIFKFLPLIFTFFFITFPAGLTLYWFVNNLLSITQQYIVNFKFAKIKADKLEAEKLEKIEKSESRKPKLTKSKKN